jgi:hypothetical protein
MAVRGDAPAPQWTEVRHSWPTLVVADPINGL